MSGLLFVSQAMLDKWAEQGSVDLQGNVLSVLAGAGKGRRYAVSPAVRFLHVVGAPADPNALVGKVKTNARLKEIGAEQIGDSVLMGEVAYEVQPGFLADVLAEAVEA